MLRRALRAEVGLLAGRARRHRRPGQLRAAGQRPGRAPSRSAPPSARPSWRWAVEPARGRRQRDPPLSVRLQNGCPVPAKAKELTITATLPDKRIGPLPLEVEDPRAGSLHRSPAPCSTPPAPGRLEVTVRVSEFDQFSKSRSKWGSGERPAVPAAAALLALGAVLLRSLPGRAAVAFDFGARRPPGAAGAARRVGSSPPLRPFSPAPRRRPAWRRRSPAGRAARPRRAPHGDAQRERNFGTKGQVRRIAGSPVFWALPRATAPSWRRQRPRPTSACTRTRSPPGPSRPSPSASPARATTAARSRSTLQVPPGFVDVSPEALPGWEVDVKGTAKLAKPVESDDGPITEGVKEIALDAEPGLEEGIPPEQFKNFPISTEIPGEAGGNADVQGGPDLQRRRSRPLDRRPGIGKPGSRDRRHRGRRGAAGTSPAARPSRRRPVAGEGTASEGASEGEANAAGASGSSSSSGDSRFLGHPPGDRRPGRRRPRPARRRRRGVAHRFGPRGGSSSVESDR